MVRKTWFLAAAVALGVLAAQASADTYTTVTADFATLSGGNNVTINDLSGPAGTYAGQYTFNYVSWGAGTGALQLDSVATELAAQAALHGNTFKTFCIDLTRNISVPSGNQTWDLMSLDAALTNIDSNSTAVTFPGSTLLNKVEYEVAYIANTGPFDNTTGEVAQLAIWYAIYGEPFASSTGLTTGSNAVAPNSSAISLVALAAASYPGAGNWESGNNVYALYNSQIQSFSVLVGSGSIVPLPAAAWVGFSMLSGMGVFGAMRRKARA